MDTQQPTLAEIRERLDQLCEIRAMGLSTEADRAEYTRLGLLERELLQTHALSPSF